MSHKARTLFLLVDNKLKEFDRQGNYNVSLKNFLKAKALTDVLKQHAIKLYPTYEIEYQKKEWLQKEEML